MKDKRRNHAFQHITKYTGREMQENLQEIYFKDKNGLIIKIHTNRTDIERVIINYDYESF